MSHPYVTVEALDDETNYVKITFGSLKGIKEIDGIPAQQPEEYDGFSEGLFSFKPDDVNDDEIASERDGFVTWREHWPNDGTTFCKCSRIAWYPGESPSIYHAKKCRLYEYDEYDTIDEDELTIIPVIKNAVL